MTDKPILSEEPNAKSYALSGKIMLSAIIILLFVVIIMVFLHLYARWYLLRARRRQLLRNRRRSQLVFYVDPTNSSTVLSGLDASVLKTIPIFSYNSSKTNNLGSLLECAVCLSEFEENEKGRTLPKCNHSFHVECIDMWFHSHSTCPLCRSPVEPVDTNNNSIELVVKPGSVVEAGSTSSSSAGGVSSTSTSSFGGRRKLHESSAGGFSIEVPRRDLDELRNESSASQSFKSPGSRIMRILSRRISMSPSFRNVGASSTSCGATTEFDIERGRAECEGLMSPQAELTR